MLQAFYEGPRIVGDLEKVNFLIGRIMNFNPKIKPHNPSIIAIIDGEFIIKDELKILMKLDAEYEIDKEALKERIHIALS